MSKKSTLKVGKHFIGKWKNIDNMYKSAPKRKKMTPYVKAAWQGTAYGTAAIATTVGGLYTASALIERNRKKRRRR